MRISEYYRLGVSQSSLDFIDVDVSGDTKLFIDPRALRTLPSEWADECVFLIQHFFRSVITAIRDGKHADAERWLRMLREPNETHLGLSRKEARGRALGRKSAHKVWQAFRKSEAAKTGLLEDLEDTILMVKNISSDIVSDIATNIIRAPLIRYTQSACEQYGIDLSHDINSGPIWDTTNSEWYSRYVDLPVADGEKLLLVPKAIVRIKLEYNCDEYYRHFILEHLREVELSANSELVQLLKNGRKRVTNKSLIGKYGKGKSAITTQTLRYPDLIRAYRKAKDDKPSKPLTHSEIAHHIGVREPDWDKLLSKVQDIPVGREHAASYEKAVEKLLTALFYPCLTNPQVQHAIHEGRKRIDITYTNMATSGFFQWLSRHYPAPHVFVECKNYGKEIGNPEMDQLSSRFSPSRGTFGILIGRKFKNKHLFMKKCRDTARDTRGYIIPIDDKDLDILVNGRKDEDESIEFNFLKSRFDKLIM